MSYRFQNRRVKHKKEVVERPTGLRPTGADQSRVKEESCSNGSCRCNCSVISSTSSETATDKAVQPLVPTTETEARFDPIVDEDSNKMQMASVSNEKNISTDAIGVWALGRALVDWRTGLRPLPGSLRQLWLLWPGLRSSDLLVNRRYSSANNWPPIDLYRPIGQQSVPMMTTVTIDYSMATNMIDHFWQCATQH